MTILPTAAGHEFPTVVVDTADKIESRRSLNEWLDHWMGLDTTVQEGIGIKIYPTSGRLRAIMRQHGVNEPHQEIESGTGVDLSTTAVLSFPRRLLYQGFLLPRELFGMENDRIVIDLMIMRSTIEASLYAPQQ